MGLRGQRAEYQNPAIQLRQNKQSLLDQSGCGLNMEEFYSPKKMDNNNTRNKQLLGGFTKGHGIEFLLEGWSFHISFWWLKSRGPVNSPGDAEEERDGTSRVGRDLKIRRF